MKPTTEKFTAAQDKQILDFIAKSKAKNKFVELSEILGIDQKYVYARYQVLTKKSSKKEVAGAKKKVIWSRKLTTKFLKTLMEVAVCTHVNQLKDLRIPRIVWLEMEKVMKIDVQDLIKFWYRQLHMQLFCQLPISLTGIKEELIGYLVNTQASSYAEIEWANVTYYFDGCTPHFLQNILYKEYVKISEITESDDFLENLKYFLDHKEEFLADDQHKYLPLVKYEDERLIFLIDEQDD